MQVDLGGGRQRRQQIGLASGPQRAHRLGQHVVVQLEAHFLHVAALVLAEQLDTLLEEITDRFGRLPAQGQVLFDTHRLRVLAKTYGVLKVDASPKLMTITFKPNPPIDAQRIIELVQRNRHIKLAGNERLRIERELAEPRDRAQFVRDVLRSLGTPMPVAA